MGRNPFSKDDNGPTCPECRNIAIRLYHINDDGSGKKVCRNCKRVARGKMPRGANKNHYDVPDLFKNIQEEPVDLFGGIA